MRFRNTYTCPACRTIWHDEWDAACNDDCPACGCRHVSPTESEDLPETEETSTTQDLVVVADAAFSWSVDVDCPACGHGIDLVDHDHDASLAKLVFGQDSKVLDDTGLDFECPFCDAGFTLRRIVY